MSGLARLVLNKQALCGLKVLFWHNELAKELEGVIEAYDQAQDSFVLYDESSGAQFAVHFHQFTVEEEQQQLVLRVTSCTLLPVPQKYRTSRLYLASDDGCGPKWHSGAEQRASDSTSLTALDGTPSTQLSAEMSQQLSGLIGQSFSGTTEGFAPVLGPTQTLGSGSESDEESYWGSPVKQQAAAKSAADSAALGAAADISGQDATTLAAASDTPPELAAVAAADGQAAEPQAAAGEGGLQQIAEANHLPLSAAGQGLVTAGQVPCSGTTSVASLRGSPAPSAGQITPVPLSSVGGSSEDLATQAAHPASHSSSFNSFQEISRIISKDEPKVAGSPIPIMKQGSKHHLGPAAARLFDEITTWGTPGDSSPQWGTPPREQHMARLVAAVDDEPSNAVQAEAARRLDMSTAAEEAGQAWLPDADAKVDDVPHESTSSTFVAAVSVATAPRVRFSEASDGGGDSDFTIAAGIDVQYRPASRTATRNTQLYRLSIPEATDDGMMVDIPQPLSTRRASRTSTRNMYLASDPGTATAASGVPLAELRRATSNMGGLLTSRRISRTTSGRVQDQDWAVGPESAQQQLPAWPMSPNMVLTANGVPVHVPGPSNRRISRTLSGRAPADQFGVADTAVLSEEEDDNAPDVLARPSTASAIALEVIPSRRESSAGGRPGTPDSDGFGFSEFEGLEPLVPPEISQWDAIAEEAVVQASEATTPAAHSHRHQRRSMRSIGGPQTVPSTPSGSRPNQRVSDQDDHIPLSPLRAALPSDWVHAITGRSLTPVSEQQGIGSSQTEPQPQLGALHIPVAQQQQRLTVGSDAADSQFAEQSTTPGRAVTETSSDAAADSAGASALESPQGASGMTETDELKRAPSKKPSLTGMLQKAAAAVVGSVFTANKSAAAEHQTAQEDGEGMTQQLQAAGNPSAAQAAEDRLPFRPQFKAHLASDSLASGDSFNCPPFMPMIGGSKANPFADPASSAFQIGTAVADAAESEQFAPGVVINKQLLPASGSLATGSEWGSGNFAAQMTSGIDTPTGSGIFKTNPFAEGSSYGSASPQGSGGLDGFPSVPGPSRAAIGASRMGRQAATTTAATMPFSGLAADSNSSKPTGDNISEISPAFENEAGEHEGAYSNAAAGVQHRLGFDGSTRAKQGLDGGEQPAEGLSSDGIAWRRRSSEPDSGGAEADDERTPLAAESLLSHFTARSSRDSDGGTRAAAELDPTSVDQPPPPAAAARGSVDADSTAPPVGSSGLVRRAASRSASQQLAGNVTVSLDGMVVLPQPNYQYGDDDQQPLMQQYAGGVGYSAGKVLRSPLESHSHLGPVVLHTFLANTTHWFDTIALVVLAGQLTAAMSDPQLSHQHQLREMFWIFAAGHVLWLIGSLLWPRVKSRRAAVAWTVCLSALPTALMGCMPAYAVGARAGLVVIASLRILSGIAHTNEGPAAAVYLADHCSDAPNLLASLVPCSMATGALGATLAALFFALALTHDQLNAFGWRLTLVATLVGHGVSGVLRAFVLQDPEQFMSSEEVADQKNGHIGRVLRAHPGQLLLAILLQAFAVSGFSLLTAWMPVYHMQYTDLTPVLALTVQAVSVAVLAGCMPLGGFLADQYGRSYVLLATCTAAALFAYPAWLLFSLSVAVVSWFSQFTLVAFVGLHWGALMGALVDMFPSGVCSSALTIATVLPMVLLGSTMPLAAMCLIQQTGSLASPAILMIATAVVTAGVSVHQVVQGRL